LGLILISGWFDLSDPERSIAQIFAEYNGVYSMLKSTVFLETLNFRWEFSNNLRLLRTKKKFSFIHIGIWFAVLTITLDPDQDQMKSVESCGFIFRNATVDALLAGLESSVA
jgi:hypothetical protein